MNKELDEEGRRRSAEKRGLGIGNAWLRKRGEGIGNGELIMSEGVGISQTGENERQKKKKSKGKGLR